MLEGGALLPGGSVAGRRPAEWGHCTPDGSERPEEEGRPSPAGSTGNWTARAVRLCVCVCMDIGGNEKGKKTWRRGRMCVCACAYVCVR